MDQNQLTPYVQQDPYPLFRHTSSTGFSEFGQLVERVFQEHINVDDGFIDALFVETAGHPFLTVNLLREFVDWLIDAERPVAGSILTLEDFAEFAAANLTRQRLGTRSEYRFFRDGAISEALGPYGRQRTPWLHAVYATMREICIAAPDTLECSRSEFDAIVDGLDLAELGFHSDLILTTASDANFLDFDDEHVRPRVRLLGRLSAVSRARVEA
jgi:hypothetical protein